MFKINKDFDFLKKIFLKFFQQKHIINRLNDIERLNISGWEIWLQVEMLIFLCAQDNVQEAYREERCFMDQRKEKLKSLCAIDFIVREKGAHSFIPIEVKQNMEAAACIRNMIKDLDKYNNIRQLELPSERDLWLIGIHRKVEQDYLFKLIDEKLDINHKYVFTQEINNTNFMFTLF